MEITKTRPGARRRPRRRRGGGGGRRAAGGRPRAPPHAPSPPHAPPPPARVRPTPQAVPRGPPSPAPTTPAAAQAREAAAGRCAPTIFHSALCLSESWFGCMIPGLYEVIQCTLSLSETQSGPQEETEGGAKGAHRARRALRLEPQGRGLRDVRAAARRLRPLLPEVCRALRSSLPAGGGRASRSAPRAQRLRARCASDLYGVGEMCVRFVRGREMRVRFVPEGRGGGNLQDVGHLVLEVAHLRPKPARVRTVGARVGEARGGGGACKVTHGDNGRGVSG